jgi:hypothetical protein
MSFTEARLDQASIKLLSEPEYSHLLEADCHYKWQNRLSVVLIKRNWHFVRAASFLLLFIRSIQEYKTRKCYWGSVAARLALTNPDECSKYYGPHITH